MIEASTEMKGIIMKKIIGLLCISLLFGSCMNTEDPPGIAETASSPAAAENSVVVTEPPTSDKRADSGTTVATASTTSSAVQNEAPSWNLTGEYFGVDGSVLEIPPESEWHDFNEYYDSENFRIFPNLESGFYDGYLLIQGSSFIRYPTGIFYDTRRTPELFQNGEFIGEEFRDSETEWVGVSVGDKIGDLSVSEAEIVYSYYSTIDWFGWHTIDSSFSGETELKGVLYRYNWTENITSYHFVPFPDSLAEQKFPMLKGMYGSSGFAGDDGYIVTGDTITIDLGEDLAIENEVNDSLNEYGYCIASVKIENIHLHAWSEDFSDGYCSADLIDFEVIE